MLKYISSINWIRLVYKNDGKNRKVEGDLEVFVWIFSFKFFLEVRGIYYFDNVSKYESF